LLRGLSPADWNAPKLAGAWTVKDVAAHLLDGNLRTLAMLRDGAVEIDMVVNIGKVLGED